LIKDGEVGAEVFRSLFTRSGRLPVGVARKLLNEVEVLMPRFLRFRGFFAGVVGLCSSKKVFGEESDDPVSVLRDLKSATNDEGVALLIGDSGDGPGEGSVTDEESIVDMVVVGELSDDSDANVDVLSLCMWNAGKWPSVEVEPAARFPLDAGRPTGLPWVPVILLCTARVLVSSPKTDMKVGIGGAKVLELPTMLDRRLAYGGRLLRAGEWLVVLLQKAGKGIVVELGNSRSHFLEGTKLLGVISEENVLFKVGLSAF
jgi:hypothetical protein